jgi:hypothetical protein
MKKKRLSGMKIFIINSKLLNPLMHNYATKSTFLDYFMFGQMLVAEWRIF